MKVSLTKPKANFSHVAAETLVVGIFEGGKVSDLPYGIDDLTEGAMSRILQKKQKTGKIFEALQFTISPKKHKNLEKLIILGFGKKENLDNFRFRQLAAAVGKQVRKENSSVSVYFPKDTVDIFRVGLLVSGFTAGLFDSGHYKTEKNDKVKVESLEIIADIDLDKAKESVRHGLIFGEATNKIREIINLPANIATPKYIADFAKKLAKDNRLAVEIFSEREVQLMGAGIMASVAKGSDEDLYFVVIKYKSPGAKKTLALVGKGITFDSGGISIKPSDSMELMKMDMAGAAAVFGAMEVIAKLALQINVVAAVPLTENLPSGKATKPGDVVSGLSGKTVEVINTDAEGRLVLSDAITYVQKELGANFIVDIATLTGASVVALGNWASAVLGKPQDFVDMLIEAAKEAGERLWQLPLYEEYRDQLKSYIADIANVSATRGGGTETGAKFLEEFVDEKVSWAHLDIAPNAWEENEKPYATRGATGVGLSTLVQIAIQLSK